jgi:glycosyltransferase involved in cell wall biosynthesis
MKILIITQKVNQEDPVLGFFHRWITEFSKKFEQVTVICLEEGKHNLPSNVKVLSLGKEVRQSRKQYLARFYSYVWNERHNYDVVLSHMNQEYVILAGFIWKLLGKRIYMWRNHHAGDELTDMASVFCNKIFCTSKYSYTIKYKKTKLMPVGIDTSFFVNERKERMPRSVLSHGRIAPVKRIDVFVEALGILKDQGVQFTADVFGEPTVQHIAHFDQIKKTSHNLGLDSQVKFRDAIVVEKAMAEYNSHEIFVNLSSSGMFDKTILESMACGCLTLASNDNLKDQIDNRLVIADVKPDTVATRIQHLLELTEPERDKLRKGMREYV